MCILLGVKSLLFLIQSLLLNRIFSSLDYLFYSTHVSFDRYWQSVVVVSKADRCTFFVCSDVDESDVIPPLLSVCLVYPASKADLSPALIMPKQTRELVAEK